MLMGQGVKIVLVVFPGRVPVLLGEAKGSSGAHTRTRTSVRDYSVPDIRQNAGDEEGWTG